MTIEELIERLEKATGPDRELDVAIGYETSEEIGGLSGSFRQYCSIHDLDFAAVAFDAMSYTSILRTGLPCYTSSIDAAVSLAERVLPGWYWRVGRTSLFPNGWAFVSRLPPDHCDRKDEAACSDGKAANPSIALCIAVLRAKKELEASQ